MFKYPLTHYILKVLWKMRHKWPRVVLASRLLGVMRDEFGTMFGQPQVAVLDEKEYDEWEMSMFYRSHSGVQIGISVFDERIEIFATGQDLIHQSYFTDDIGNVEEARGYLVKYVNNVARDIEEDAKLGLTDKK